CRRRDCRPREGGALEMRKHRGLDLVAAKADATPRSLASRRSPSTQVGRAPPTPTHRHPNVTERNVSMLLGELSPHLGSSSLHVGATSLTRSLAALGDLNRGHSACSV